MNRDLRKCYDVLNLPFSATIEEVEIRQFALIKGFNDKSLEKGISYDKQIGEIETSANLIIENIKKNGIPKDECHRFESSWKSIIILGIILLCVALVCGFSFYVFL